MPVFFDTNVLVYCADNSSAGKRERARELVYAAALAGEAVLSTQVLLELFNVLTRKLRIPARAAQAVAQSYAQWSVVPSDTLLVQAAMDTAAAHQLSIWDAMVVAAALRAEAHTLYTEDLSHGQSFGTLTVVNPFLA